MPTRLTLLAAAVALSFAPVADADPLPMLQPSGTLTFPDKSTPNPPLFISADQMDGVQDKFLNASGSVELHRGVAVLTAHKIHYTLSDDTVTANGDVCLVQQGLTLLGPSLLMHMQQQTGTMDRPVYTYVNPMPMVSKNGSPGVRQARGDASAIQFEGNDHYRLDHATYTTCPAGNNDWQLHVKDLSLDMVQQVGTAHNVVIDFHDTPILFTPWINFPLNDARKSGFLAPTIGTTGNSGGIISLPWYWNIAPNYDATIDPSIITKRGMQLGGEFRYLTPSMHGSIAGDFLQDHLTGTDRWDLFVMHDETFTPNISGHLVYQAVSDNNYFRDLSNQLNLTSLATLDQEGSMTYHTSWWSATALVQQFQTLQDPQAPIVPPYARLPDLSWQADKILPSGVEANMYTDLTEFVHPTLVNGTRFVAYPSISMPLTTPWGYLTPKFGVNYTQYALGLNNTAPQSQYTRTLPITSLDTGMYFDRNVQYFGHAYQQSLEPRLYYLYIPYQNQNQLPNFDTAILDPVNYATLFTENRYVGYDRINNANQITMAMTSRITDAQTGLERLQFSLGQRFYFTPQMVTLPGETPITSTSSDILGDVGGQINESWRAEAAVSYNTSSGQTDDQSLVLNYQPEPGKVINFSYLTVSGQVDQVDISTQWPISRHWYGLMRYDYSLLDQQVVEGLAGIEYNGGCWAIRTVMQTIATAANTTSTSLFVQLELNGLANLGSNPDDALKLSIPGYINSNEIIPRTH
ncbi:MAG: LPS-assembly protein LptD [Betaproteobacteria bacterium]|nr:LPS-assembly protein LptD [Betaproteobacteria bacterium]